MRREIAASLALATSLSMSGCVMSHGNHSIEIAVTSDAQPKLDFNTLPDALPEPVSEEMFNVVRVIRLQGDLIDYGSGVLIDTSNVITAGHMLYNKDNLPEPSSNVCDSVQVEAAGTRLGDIGVSIIGNAVSARKHVGTYKDIPNPSHLPDISMMDVSKSKEKFLQVPPIRFRHSPIKVGDPVFFVNYEPVNDLVDRNPDFSQVQDPFLRAPAMYGGIVSSRYEDGMVSVVTSLRSYGVIDDASTRGGASGGAAFDRDGKLVGILVSSLREQIAAKQLPDVEGVSLRGVRPDQKISITNIQSVTEELIGRLGTQLAAAQDCTP